MGKTKKRYDPALSTMSLGDHLEELRSRLIMALLGLLIGTIVCLGFGKKIILFIEQPYNRVVEEYMEKKMGDPNESSTSTVFNAFCTHLIEKLNTDPNAPALDPNGVRYVQTAYRETVHQLSLDGLSNESPFLLDAAASRYRLQTLAPADAFIGYMKISIITGLVLSCPWVFYQIWMFVAAGLYDQERAYVRKAVPFSAALFIMGALFFLFVVAPISLRFFLTFGDLIGVAPSWTFQKYISFVTILMLVFGVAFQTPIAIFILHRTGLVSLESLRASRKFVFLGMVVLSAIATPPDVISQITLAVPLYFLFELGMFLSAHFNQEQTETETS